MININNIFCCNFNLKNNTINGFYFCTFCKNELFIRKDYCQVYNQDDSFFLIENNSLIYIYDEKETRKEIIANFPTNEIAINKALYLINNQDNLIFL